MSAECRGARNGPGRATAWSPPATSPVLDDGSRDGTPEESLGETVPLLALTGRDEPPPQAASARADSRHATTAARRTTRAPMTVKGSCGCSVAPAGTVQLRRRRDRRERVFGRLVRWLRGRVA